MTAFNQVGSPCPSEFTAIPELISKYSRPSASYNLHPLPLTSTIGVLAYVPTITLPSVSMTSLLSPNPNFPKFADFGALTSTLRHAETTLWPLTWTNVRPPSSLNTRWTVFAWETELLGKTCMQLILFCNLWDFPFHSAFLPKNEGKGDILRSWIYWDPKNAKPTPTRPMYFIFCKTKSKNIQLTIHFSFSLWFTKHSFCIDF